MFVLKSINIERAKYNYFLTFDVIRIININRNVQLYATVTLRKKLILPTINFRLIFVQRHNHNEKNKHKRSPYTSKRV